MKKSAKTLIGIAACSALFGLTSGCMTYNYPTHGEVTYISIPAYAGLYSDSGEYLGEAPYKYTFSIGKKEINAGGVIRKGMIARWVSGAERRALAEDISIKKSPSPYSYYLNSKVVLSRPRDAPNLEMDINYALNQEELEIKKQNADANSRASWAAEKAAKAAEDAETRRHWNDTLRRTQEAIDYMKSQQ